MHFEDMTPFREEEGATLCPNIQLMSSLSARSATVDRGVTAPSPVTQTEECTAVVFVDTMRHERKGLEISEDTRTSSECKQLHAPYRHEIYILSVQAGSEMHEYAHWQKQM